MPSRARDKVMVESAVPAIWGADSLGSGTSLPRPKQLSRRSPSRENSLSSDNWQCLTPEQSLTLERNPKFFAAVGDVVVASLHKEFHKLQQWITEHDEEWRIQFEKAVLLKLKGAPLKTGPLLPENGAGLASTIPEEATCSAFMPEGDDDDAAWTIQDQATYSELKDNYKLDGDDNDRHVTYFEPADSSSEFDSSILELSKIDSHYNYKARKWLRLQDALNLGDGERGAAESDETSSSVMKTRTWTTKYVQANMDVEPPPSLLKVAFEYFGYGDSLREEAPVNALTAVLDTKMWLAAVMLLILLNTAIVGVDADIAIQNVLQEPPGENPSWLHVVNTIFTVIFAMELLFRMIALGFWFWLDPHDWAWNAFDAGVVFISLVTFFLGSSPIGFFRTLRVLRAARAARLLRVFRFSMQLRRILCLMIQCMGSLVWCFVFLVLTIFLFSVFLLQGLSTAIGDMPRDSDERAAMQMQTREWYPSLLTAMLSLLASCTGGAEWLSLYEPVTHAGWVYSTCLLCFHMLVTVGVFNVLTTIFLANASEISDHDLLVQDELVKMEGFVQQIQEFLRRLNTDRDGFVEQEELYHGLQEGGVLAFLSVHGLEPAHLRLVFELLDAKGEGRVSETSFVAGLMKFRVQAKAVDARTIQYQLGLIPTLVRQALHAELEDQAATTTRTHNPKEHIYQEAHPRNIAARNIAVTPAGLECNAGKDEKVAQSKSSHLSSGASDPQPLTQKALDVSDRDLQAPIGDVASCTPIGEDAGSLLIMPQPCDTHFMLYGSPSEISWWPPSHMLKPPQPTALRASQTERPADERSLNPPSNASSEQSWRV